MDYFISAASTPPLHISSAGDDAFLLFCSGSQFTTIWQITFNEMSPINTGPCIVENLKRASEKLKRAMDSFFTEKRIYQLDTCVSTCAIAHAHTPLHKIPGSSQPSCESDVVF